MASTHDGTAALATVEFLARSPNRVAALTTLADGPRSRHELREHLDVSRVTLSRILDSLDERGWIRRENGQYLCTPAGTLVAESLGRFLVDLETIGDLDDALEWLPVHRFEFPIARLRNARVTERSWTDHTASIRRVAELVRSADRIRGTASGVSRDVLEAFRAATVDDDASGMAILDDTAMDIVSGDPELAGHVEAMLAAGVDVYHYEGPEAPLLMVMVCDEHVLVCGHGDSGPPGVLESTDPAVRDWATAYIEHIRKGATPLRPETIAV